MRLSFRFAAAMGLATAMLLIGGKPAYAQTVTPTTNPFHVVTGTTSSEGFTYVNNTTEQIRLDSIGVSFPGTVSFAFGPGVTAVTLAVGESRQFTDVFRIGSNAAPGTTATLPYAFGFRGLTTNQLYSVNDTLNVVVDAPGTVPTVPEPSTAALLLPALGAVPLCKLRRRKRHTATA